MVRSALEACIACVGHDVYCSVLQCVAACCSVLQCVAVCCSVLQCEMFEGTHGLGGVLWDMAHVWDMMYIPVSVQFLCAVVCCSVCAVCCSVFQYVAVRCSMVQCAAVCLQCVDSVL